MSFYSGMRSPVARLAFAAHQVGARLRLPAPLLRALRGMVHGRLETEAMTIDLRRGTWDAWTAHPGHEAETHAWIEECCLGGEMFDVGAYCGTFSLRHHSRFDRIHCFEASRENFGALERNIAASGLADKVVAIHAAAAAAPGTVRLYLSAEDTHSLIGEGAFEETEAIRLDDYWERIGRPPVSLIKIDVEGGEPSVVAGAVRVIQETGCAVLTEAYTSEEKERLRECMRPLGYEHGPIMDGRNIVFTRRDDAPEARDPPR